MKMSHRELCRLCKYTGMTLDVFNSACSVPETLNPKVQYLQNRWGDLVGKDVPQCHPCCLCKQVEDSAFDPRKEAVYLLFPSLYGCQSHCLGDGTIVLKHKILHRFSYYKCVNIVKCLTPVLRWNFF